MVVAAALVVVVGVYVWFLSHHRVCAFGCVCVRL